MASNQTAECPFNPNHKVPDKRLIWHIIKCQRNLKPGQLKNLTKVRCSWNPEHWVDQNDIVEHMQNQCGSRPSEQQVKFQQDFIQRKSRRSKDQMSPKRHKSLESSDSKIKVEREEIKQQDGFTVSKVKRKVVQEETKTEPSKKKPKRKNPQPKQLENNRSRSVAKSQKNEDDCQNQIF